jgi:hypothetical protein
MTRLVFALLLLVALFTTETARSQVPLKERQFVYGINAFAWTGYAGSLSARPSHTIYVLADHRSMVSARETLVYFWPITGEYRADWSGLNASVPGTLEVLVAGRAATMLARQLYVIQYPNGPDTEPSVLYVGEEADRRYHLFVDARERYRDAAARYLEARRRYLEALDKAVAARQHGAPVTLPSPPAEPQQFRLFSSEVHDGFLINLPPGQYTIRVRGSDGQVIPGSQRSLVAFTHRREAVGFTIVPQTRWTVPERADEPSSTIYARRDQTLYFQPFAAREYSDIAYARLANPQSAEGRSDGWRWEYTQSLASSQLQTTGGSGVEKISIRPYRVEQKTGEALGYEVIEPPPGQAADFAGFKVHVEGTLSIALLDTSGRPVRGSERIVRVPRLGTVWPLGIIPLLPLGVGAAVVAWRREQVGRTPRPREG